MKALPPQILFTFLTSKDNNNGTTHPNGSTYEFFNVFFFETMITQENIRQGRKLEEANKEDLKE